MSTGSKKNGNGSKGAVVKQRPKDASTMLWECYPQILVRVKPDPTSTSVKVERERARRVAIEFVAEALKKLPGVELLDDAKAQQAPNVNYLPWDTGQEFEPAPELEPEPVKETKPAKKKARGKKVEPPQETPEEPPKKRRSKKVVKDTPEPEAAPAKRKRTKRVGSRG